jgi:hypothetical protein
MVRMGVNPEQTKAPKPVPAAWYELRLKSLTCKKSPKGHNYLAMFYIVNSKAEYNDSAVFFQMNNGFRQALDALDCCHGLGFPLETDGSFPGDWKLKDDNKPDDFDGAQYTGVLLGKTCEAELTTDTYQGNEKNVVRQFKCKVQQCADKFPDIRHRTDLIGKK